MRGRSWNAAVRTAAILLLAAVGWFGGGRAATAATPQPAATSRAASATQPEAEKWDYEQYYAAYMNGQRAGYMAERERKLPDGGIETFEGFKLSVAAAGQVVRATIIERRTESADGRPVRFSQWQLLGLTPVELEGVVRDGQLELTTIQGGRRLVKTQAWDERVRFGAACQRIVKDKLKADGDQAVVWEYDPELPGTGIAPTTIKRVGHEEVTVNGRKVRALHTTASNPLSPAPMEDWVNEDFRSVAAVLNLGAAMTIRLEACSKAFAHEQFDAPEFFNNTLVRLSAPLKNPENIRSLRLTITYDKPLDGPLALPESDRQRVVESTRTRLVLMLSRPAYPKLPAGGEGAAGDDLNPYLKAEEQFNTEDPEIQAAARKAVGGRTDSLARAKAIRDWVDDRLTFKEMGVMSGTASEVVRSRTGDCTEHAVLLVALARAAGIPARTVQGLVYAPVFGGQRDVLGGHMWAQLYVRGRWVDFDAAIPGDPAIAVRVALGVSDADGKLPLGGEMGILKLFGNVKSATVDEVERE